jgi:hypothetical protein
MELSTYERDYLAWYARETDSTGDPFDPSTLVAAARAQWSDRPQLVLALARCTRSWQRNALYTFFLSRSAQRTRWHYAGHLFLQHPGWGTLCVDLLHDPAVPGGLSIGGIEYWDRVMGRPVDLGQLHQAFLRLAVQRMARTGGS